jgi:Tol biopolymer transport system component
MNPNPEDIEMLPKVAARQADPRRFIPHLLAGVLAMAVALPGHGQYIHWLSEPPLELGNLPNAGETRIRISLDGSTASILAAATNLVDTQGGPVRNLYVVNLQTGQRYMAAGSLSGELLPPLAGNTRLAFLSRDSHLPDPPPNGFDRYLYIEDLTSGTVENHSDDGAGGFIDMERARVDETASHAFFETFTTLDPLHVDFDLQIYRKTLATDSFELVSISEDGLAAANDRAVLIDISPNGRYVVFESEATNLVSEPLNNTRYNLYRRDLQTGTTTLVNIQPDGSSSTGSNSFFNAAVSNFGSVVFTAAGDDLVPGDTNGARDVFLSINGLIRRINLDPDGNELDAFVFEVAISADGTRAAFTEAAPEANGELADSGARTQMYVYNVETDELRLVSATAADLRSDGTVQSPALSGDGRRAVFASSSTDLDGNPFHGIFDRAYVASLVNGQLAPAIQPELPVNTIIADASFPRSSANQRFVAFRSSSPNLVEDPQGEPLTGLFVLDRETDSFEHVASGTLLHDLSPSGRYLAFSASVLPPLGEVDLGSRTVFLYDRQDQSYTQVESGGALGGTQPRVDDTGRVVFDSDVGLLPSDSNGFRDAYLFDSQTGTLTLLSADGSGQAVGGFNPDVTTVGNSTFVTFASGSDSLVPGDDEGHADVFLLTLPGGNLSRISQAAGDGGNGLSWLPAIADGGRYIAFISEATNLTADDYSTAGEEQVLRYDRITGQIELASVNEFGEPLQSFDPRLFWPPSISASGRYVSFGFEDFLDGEDFAADVDGGRDVILHDFASGESMLISATLDGESEGIVVDGDTAVAEDTSVSPARVGVVFAAIDGGQLTGATQPPRVDELFLHQFGGPPQAFNLIIDGAGSVTGNRGIDCSDQCSYAFDLGAGLQLIATPDPGEQFLGWTFDERACGEQDVPCNFAFPGEMTATARFSGGVVVDDIFADRFEGD